MTFFPPVATAEYRPDPARRAAARAELGIPPRSLAIGTVGNLNPQKGHEFLIQATGIVRKTCPGVELRILGARTPTQPEYEQRLRSDAAELGLERAGVSIFVEPGARVAELLPAFDVFVLSALPLSEGIPTVILEAMACGLPVVSTDVGAVREAVEDCATGYVVPAEDSSAIANRVLRLLGDAELRARMGALARARAVERYDSQACADVHQRAFELAVAHAARRRRRPSRRATSG